MTTHHTAQGLASLGRHGDTMLVHMSPHEVAGLNYLAKKQGTKLTVNPDTGLPEAFSLGGFFSSLLPMFAGAMMPASFGAMAPLLAGAATGGALAAAKGENPLMGGIMGGLGGYSGGNLASSLGAAANPLSTAGGWTPGQTIAQSALPNAAGMADSGALSTVGGAGNIGNPALSSAANTVAQSGFANSALSGSGNIIDPALNRLSQAGTGLKNIATGQPGAWDAFKAAGGSGMKLAMPVGGAILGGLEPSDIYGEPIKPSDKDKYDPYSTLKLSNDTGLRLVAKGGYIDSKDYALGGTVTTGGLRDLYATTDSPANPQLSRDGYGVGRLDSLARQQSMNQAQTTGYADGGSVASSDSAATTSDTPGSELPSDFYMSDIQRSLMGRSPVHYTGASSSPGFSSSRPYGSDMIGEMLRVSPEVFRYDYGVGRGTSPLAARRREYDYAMGGPVSFADGGDANKEALGLVPIDQTMGIAALTPSATTPTAPGQAMAPSQVQNMASALSGPTSSDNSIITKVANDLRADPNYKPTNPIEAAIAKQIRGTDATQQSQGIAGLGAQPSQPMAPTYNPSVAMGPTYYAGMNAPRGFAEGGETHLNLDTLPSLNVNSGEQIAASRPGNDFENSVLYKLATKKMSPEVLRNVGTFGIYQDSPNNNMYTLLKNINPAFENKLSRGFEKGGYLDGQGDGMSDSIPATIEGKQPARLADGEFVVPADVVSHIGNGSSKAGSQRLYSMLDRVRKARTGHTKQGKQIKPEKYMPA